MCLVTCFPLQTCGWPGNPSKPSLTWDHSRNHCCPSCTNPHRCPDSFENYLFTNHCSSQSMARHRTLNKCPLFKKIWGGGDCCSKLKSLKQGGCRSCWSPPTDFFYLLEDTVTAETAEVLSCFQRALWWGIQHCSCGTARDTWLGCKKVKNRAQRARMSVMKLLLQQNGKC